MLPGLFIMFMMLYYVYDAVRILKTIETANKTIFAPIIKLSIDLMLPSLSLISKSGLFSLSNSRSFKSFSFFGVLLFSCFHLPILYRS